MILNRGVMLRRPFFLGICALAATVGIGCEKGETANNSPAYQVDEIVRAYAARNNAKSALKRMGYDVIPYLREKLDMGDADYRAVAGVLLDLGGERSLAVFVDALWGKTKMPKYQAASYVQAFESKYKWDSARFRQVDGLVVAALDLLIEERNTSGVNLVHRLRLIEAVPILKEMKADADSALRQKIETAIVDIEADATTNSD